MPTSSSGIAYDEVDPSVTTFSPREQWRPDGTFVAVRTLKCAWSDRETLISDFGANGGEVYPNLSSSPALAGGASLVARGTSFPSGDVLAHDWAMIEVYYFWSPYLPTWINNTLVSESIRTVSEHVRLDPEQLKWANGTPLELGEAPGVTWPMLDYSVTFHRIAYETTEHYTWMGTCNANIVTPYTLVILFPVETLAYQGPRVQRSLGLAGLSKVDVTLTFRYRPQGWNRQYRPSTNEWEYYYGWADEQVIPLPLVAY